jgi:predicted enzyme related to lactoylglutathione lyase
MGMNPFPLPTIEEVIMPNPITHLEISAHDHVAAAEWYRSLFGWKIQSFPEMNYSTADPGDGATGIGFNPVTEEQPAGTVVAYIQCEDIEETLARISEAGGDVMMEPLGIPGVGRMAQFVDPSGNRMAVLEPAMPEE